MVTRTEDPSTANGTTSPAPQPSRIGLVARMLAAVVGLGFFAWTMRDLDGSRLHELLVSVGPIVVLIVLPQAIGTLLHAAAWRELLAALGTRVPLFALTRVFLGSEGARMAMPAGAAVGESVAAFEVKSRFDSGWPKALASLAAKKAWVLCTHAICLVALFVVGGAALERLGANLPAGHWLLIVLWGMTISLVLAGGLTLTLLASRRAARTTVRIASRVPIAALRNWAAERAHHPELAAAAAIAPVAHLKSGALLLAQWVTEFAETWLILRLLGTNVTFTEALAIELGSSLVRALAFVVPGGLGVTDASYVGMLAALGVPNATEVGAGFVLLKRAKEIFFIAVGLGALARRPALPTMLAAPDTLGSPAEDRT
ncbi:MAG TPA: lysylphosphatidylglycerol synthase transmembrane domain-containing protein [Polyangiaceae bacterium]|jgi:uncharacterized membrane protein YbhN (UPF0104 family)|nr:lysylphosphatidylglycerol synthase transmembrane domain-containing protein [Polyangiaceae bacterium]